MSLYKESFIPWLSEKAGKCYYNGSKTEIIILCPWCEGITNKRHGHLYISTSDPVFYCQRCGEGGSILKLISNLGGKLSELVNEDVIKQSSNYSYTKKTLDVNGSSLTIASMDQTNCVNLDIKKKYLYDRLGKEIDLNKIPRLILSLKTFLTDNNIQVSDWQKDYLDNLEQYYVGFLSNNGTTIVFRNCFTEKTNLNRYFKFNIKTNNSYFLDFYGIKTGIQNEEIPNIVLCEGVFDMIVPLFDKNSLLNLKNNSIYWASCLGKGSYYKTYLSVLDHCKLPMSNLYVLSDTDVSLDFYRILRNNPFVGKLFICYNRHKKDFGEVPIDLIMEEVKQKRRSAYVKRVSSHSQNN